MVSVGLILDRLKKDYDEKFQFKLLLIVSDHGKMETSSEYDSKSRSSMSPDKAVGLTASSMTEDRMTPDSSHLSPGGSKKRPASIIPLAASPSGRQSSAIQRVHMDKIAKEIRTKQVNGKKFQNSSETSSAIL